MKRKYLTLIILFITLIFIFGLSNYTYAANAVINASNLEVEPNTTITLNSSITDASSWELDVSTTGGKLTKSDDRVGTTGSGQNESQTVKLGTFSASEAGTYKITLSGYVVDGSGDTPTKQNVSGTVTITVKEKEQPQPENPQPENPQPENPQPENPQPENPQPENPQPENPQPENPQPENPQPEQPSFTNVDKTMYATDALNIRKSYTKNSDRVGYLEKGDSISVIGIGSNGWFKVITSNGIEGYAAGEYLTDTKPSTTESSIATLSSIKVNPGNLNETFSKDNFSYTMTVEAEVDRVNVTATPTDNKANVTITGNTGLTTGTENVINIRVVAENGSSRIYKIKVTKLASEDDTPNVIEDPNEVKFGLKSLSIDGINISPEFKNDVYEYTAKLTDMTVEKLVVNAQASLEDAKVEITGADKIKNGENLITIIVTSADGEQTVTYQITVNKEEKVVTPVLKTEPKEDNGNTKIIFVIGAVVAIVLLVGAFIIIKKKEKIKPMKIYEDGDYNESYDDYDNYHEEERSRSEDSIENNESDEPDEYEENDEEEDDDDWGTPKRGFMNKFKKSGRHF